MGYESSDAVNDNEDELVQEALQVRSKALAVCREDEKRCERLHREQRDLKAQRKKLQRACNTADTDLRRADNMAKQRQSALRTLCDEAASTKAVLEMEIEAKAEDLNKTNELSNRLNQNLHGLIAKHNESLEENDQAKIVLQQFRNVDTFKKIKEKECAEVDAELRRMQTALEDQMSQYRAQITELQGQLGDLQTRYDQKCAVAERELENQIGQKKRSVEEVELQVAAQIRELEDLRQSKALALRSQISHHQQRVKDVVSTSQTQ